MLLKMPLFHSVFMLSSIPLHVCIYIYTCIYVYALFIRSSLNGYLGCVHVLATINSAAVNIGGGGACIFPNHTFLWLYAQGLDCRIIHTTTSVFGGTSLLFSTWLPQFTSHPHAGGLPFLHTLSHIYHLQIL